MTLWVATLNSMESIKSGIMPAVEKNITYRYTGRNEFFMNIFMFMMNKILQINFRIIPVRCISINSILILIKK